MLCDSLPPWVFDKLMYMIHRVSGFALGFCNGLLDAESLVLVALESGMPVTLDNGFSFVTLEPLPATVYATIVHIDVERVVRRLCSMSDCTNIEVGRNRVSAYVMLDSHTVNRRLVRTLFKLLGGRATVVTRIVLLPDVSRRNTYTITLNAVTGDGEARVVVESWWGKSTVLTCRGRGT